MDRIDEIIDVEFPANGWIWIDNLPIVEIRLRNLVRILIPQEQNIPLEEVRIRGFGPHYKKRKWIRWLKYCNRMANDAIWCGDEDVLDLQILFGERVYEEERWD